MHDLGQQVAATIDELDLPEGDLVTRVLNDVALGSDLDRRSALDRGYHWRGSRRMPRLGLAFAASTLLVVLAVVAIEPARSAVADILGFGATRFDQTSDLDTAPRADNAPRADTTVEVPEPNTADAVDEAINPLPALGQPLIEDGDFANRRRYLWAATDALPVLEASEFGLVLEVRTLAGAPDTKQLGGQPGVEFLTIEVEAGEVQALWLPNSHDRVLSNGAGGVATDPVRSGPTLLWIVDEMQFRLEADVGLERAIELAAAVTGGTGLLAPG